MNEWTQKTSDTYDTCCTFLWLHLPTCFALLLLLLLCFCPFTAPPPRPPRLVGTTSINPGVSPGHSCNPHDSPGDGVAVLAAHPLWCTTSSRRYGCREPTSYDSTEEDECVWVMLIFVELLHQIWKSGIWTLEAHFLRVKQKKNLEPSLTQQEQSTIWLFETACNRHSSFFSSFFP